MCIRDRDKVENTATFQISSAQSLIFSRRQWDMQKIGQICYTDKTERFFERALAFVVHNYMIKNFKEYKWIWSEIVE